jgi:hypothetical protein
MCVSKVLKTRVCHECEEIIVFSQHTNTHLYIYIQIIQYLDSQASTAVSIALHTSSSSSFVKSERFDSSGNNKANNNANNHANNAAHNNANDNANDNAHNTSNDNDFRLTASNPLPLAHAHAHAHALSHSPIVPHVKQERPEDPYSQPQAASGNVSLFAIVAKPAHSDRVPSVGKVGGGQRNFVDLSSDSE